MREWTVIAYAVMGLGCLIAVFGLLGRRNWREKLEKERARTTGVVVEQIEKTDGRRGAPLCRLIIGFTADGTQQRARWGAIVAVAEWPVGREVELLYDPDHPENIHLAEQEGENPPMSVMRTGILLIAVALVAVLGLRWLGGGPGRAPFGESDRDRPRVSTFAGDPDRVAGSYRIRPGEAGTASILEYSGTDEQVALPLIVDGCLIRGFSGSAFAGNTFLRGIVVHGMVDGVPSGAFMGCVRLSSVTLEEGVQTVGTIAFHLCPGLKDVTLPASLTLIDDNAFQDDCTAVFHVVEGSYAADWCAKRGFRFEAE